MPIAGWLRDGAVAQRSVAIGLEAQLNRRLLLARVIERVRDEGHLALHATVLAENTASMAMLRRAGFVSRSGTGVLPAFELAVTQPHAHARAPAESRRRNP